MKFSVVSVDNETRDIENLMLFILNRSEETPVDDVNLIFIYPGKIGELKSITIRDDENDIIFEGIIDEQRLIVSGSGVFLKLYARSRAAYLVDNQAMPRVYTLPSLSIIFDKHVRPYGFNNILYSGDVCLSTFNVIKGMSEWDVLNSFCNLSIGRSPRISKDGIVLTKRLGRDEKVIISNRDDGIPFTDFQYRIKRYEQISEVYARVQKEGAYSERIVDQDAITRGITRKKYINAVNGSGESLNNARKAVALSKKRSKEYKVSVLSDKIPDIGAPAAIYSDTYGNMDNLYISGVKYFLNSVKNTCEITLREEIT